MLYVYHIRISTEIFSEEWQYVKATANLGAVDTGMTANWQLQ